jgi:hypothetical protein
MIDYFQAAPHIRFVYGFVTRLVTGENLNLMATGPQAVAKMPAQPIFDGPGHRRILAGDKNKPHKHSIKTLIKT